MFNPEELSTYNVSAKIKFKSINLWFESELINFYMDIDETFYKQIEENLEDKAITYIKDDFAEFFEEFPDAKIDVLKIR